MELPKWSSQVGEGGDLEGTNSQRETCQVEISSDLGGGDRLEFANTGATGLREDAAENGVLNPRLSANEHAGPESCSSMSKSIFSAQ